MNHPRRPLLSASLFLGLCSGAIAQSSYDVPWDNSVATFIGREEPIGNGQSFYTPTGGYTKMLDFSFWIADFGEGTDTGTDMFTAQVYQWDGSTTVGSAIYTDNLGTRTFGASFTQLIINPNVDLIAGDQYIATLTDTTNNALFWMAVNTSQNPGDGGGNLVYNSGDWQNYAGVDMAWHADFSSPSGSPEPFTIGLGIAGLGIAARRRLTGKTRFAR